MSIYVGDEDFQEVKEDIVSSGKFPLEGWLYATPIEDITKHVLEKLCSIVFLRDVQGDANKRKIALKIYKNERNLIESQLTPDVLSRYYWVDKNEQSIFDYEEQKNIAKLVVFLMEFGSEYYEKSQQFMNQLFPFIRRRIEKEREGYKFREEAEERKSIIENDPNYPTELKVLNNFAIEKGCLFALEMEDVKVLTNDKYLEVFTYVFYNKYIKKFENTHLFIAREKDLFSYLRWALNRNKEFIEKYENGVFADVAKKFSMSLVSLKKDNSVTLGTMKIKFHKKNSVIGIINEYRNKIIDSRDNLQREFDRLSDKRLSKALKKAPDALKVVNNKLATFDIANLLAGNFINDTKDRMRQCNLIMEIYRLQLISADSTQAHILAFTESKKETFFELLRLEFDKKVLYEINQLFESYKIVKNDLSNLSQDWHELKTEELAKKIDNNEIDTSIFFDELSMFVNSALIVLQKHYDNRISYQSDIKQVEEEKNNEIERLREEVIKLKIDVKQKELSINQLNEEKESMKDDVVLSNKKDSRIESLEAKLEESRLENAKLAKKLEEQEPIIIEKKVNAQGLSEEETLKFLKSDDEKIVFVGGHQLMIAKMRQWAQKVEFIEPRDYNKEISQKATVVIICVAYLNHSMYHKTLARIEQIKEEHDVKLIYINTQSTNKEYLLKEIGSQL